MSHKARREIGTCFLFGLLSAVPAMLLEGVLGEVKLNTNLIRSIFTAFIVTALTEELLRYIILRWRLGSVSEPLAGSCCLLLGAVGGLGFGTIEHILAILYADLENGWTSELFTHLILIVPFHCLAGATIGYFVGAAIRHRHEWLSLLGVLLTIILHGLNNFNLELQPGIHSQTRLQNLVVVLITLALVVFIMLKDPMRLGMRATTTPNSID